jgi:hypothetical protein
MTSIGRAGLGLVAALVAVKLAAPSAAASTLPGGGAAVAGAMPFIFGGGGGGPGGVLEPGKLLERFDKNGDKRLDAEERKAAYEFVTRNKKAGRPGLSREPVQPGLKLAPKDVESFPEAPFYDAATLRTLFLQIDEPDWEKQMVAFHRTDVDLPATLIVDGKTYPDVGVHFHGESSFQQVGDGHKHSLVVSLDFVHAGQRLYGYHKLNLLNMHQDPSFARTLLAQHITRQYLPTPRANLVRVVINGESWGVYVNAQHFSKEFIKEWYGTTKGARWKVTSGAAGALIYQGENPAAYKRGYELKSKEDAAAWTNLVRLCRVLGQTPAEKLEATLRPLLDLDEVLKFLALQNMLMNKDGYWSKTSDYDLYLDEKGRFHILPYDLNESFYAQGGPVRGGANKGSAADGTPRPIGVELPPLAGEGDPRKPLISKLLAVPALRTRYLVYLREMTEQWLDWNKLGPVAQQYQALLAPELKADTRKLYSYDAFLKSFTDEPEGGSLRAPGAIISLKTFVEKRRAFLLNHADLKKRGAK